MAEHFRKHSTSPVFYLLDLEEHIGQVLPKPAQPQKVKRQKAGHTKAVKSEPADPDAPAASASCVASAHGLHDWRCS